MRMDLNIQEVSARIRSLREDLGITQQEMAAYTGRTLAEYAAQESGEEDLSFTFLSKVAKRLGVDAVELLIGENPRLSRYSICRAGEGLAVNNRRASLKYLHMAPYFKDAMCIPLTVTATYSEEEQHKPIHLSKHVGQEFEYVVKGTLRFSYEGHEEVLHEGDSILFDSSHGHGMIAAGGEDCTFLAIVMGELTEQVG